MKKLLLLLLLFTMALPADCSRVDRTHIDMNVVRCPYSQEDIYKSYAQKPTCHGCEQRRKECFYCKCPIDEHTKCEAPQKYCANQCNKKGPFDEELRYKMREKEYKKSGYKSPSIRLR